MEPGDSYDEVLRDLDRRLVVLTSGVRHLAIGLAFSGVASLCAIALSMLR